LLGKRFLLRNISIIRESLDGLKKGSRVPKGRQNVTVVKILPQLREIPFSPEHHPSARNALFIQAFSSGSATFEGRIIPENVTGKDKDNTETTSRWR
jgi:hypothetical protein